MPDDHSVARFFCVEFVSVKDGEEPPVGSCLLQRSSAMRAQAPPGRCHVEASHMVDVLLLRPCQLAPPSKSAVGVGS